MEDPSLFDDLDRQAAASGAASAVVVCADGLVLTIQAGGLGVLSSAEHDVHHAYEVIASQRLSGPWEHYLGETGDNGYGLVPRPLITHTIARHGGVGAPVHVGPARARQKVLVECFVHGDQAAEVVARIAEAFDPVGTVRLGGISVLPA